MMDTTKVVPKGHHFSNWNSHDGLRGKKFHWKTRWSVRPVPYYIIDFGLSTRCATKETLVLGHVGQDKGVPELSKDVPYNPFPVDVYHFGNVLKRCVKVPSGHEPELHLVNNPLYSNSKQDYTGLDVFASLAVAMTKPDARDRPSISKSLEMCKTIIFQVTKSGNLKSRVWRIITVRGDPLGPRDRLKVRLLGWNPTNWRPDVETHISWFTSIFTSHGYHFVARIYDSNRHWL